MNRERALPRVTYSNIRADFSGVHAELDRRIGEFEREELGHTRANRIGGRDDTRGEAYAVASPIDADLLLGTLQSRPTPRRWTRRSPRRRRRSRRGQREPAATRVAILRAVAAELERRKWDLAIAALLEVGKSRMEALGEAEEAIDMIRYYAAEARGQRRLGARPLQRAFPQRRDVRPAASLRRLRRHRAVQLPDRAVGGHADRRDPHRQHGGVQAESRHGAHRDACWSRRSRRAASRRAWSTSCAAAPTRVACWCGIPGVAGFVFTGSHRTGMEILRHCASGRYHRPVIVEMGGKNPAYVTATADLDVAAEGVTRSAFGLSGPEVLGALAAVRARGRRTMRLLERIAARTRALAVGDPRSAGVFTGPVIDAAGRAALRRRGGRSARGGRHHRLRRRDAVRRPARPRRLRRSRRSSAISRPTIG